jgi:hypothetical protein
MAHNARPGGGGMVRPVRPELRATWQWYSIFGGFSSYGTGVVQGTHRGGLLRLGGFGAGHAVAKFELQPSVMVGGHSKGWLTTRLGKTGASRDVEYRYRVDGTRGASHGVW